MSLRADARDAALQTRSIIGNANVYFVSSVTGGSGNDGTTYDGAFATIAQALAVCVAGDFIFLLAGHNEGFANATLDIAVEGVTIVGLGRGTRCPRIDYDHANASINIQAHSVAIKNVRLLPSVTAVAIGIDIEAGKTDALLEDIEVLPGEDGAGVDEFVLAIDVKAGCSRTRIVRPKIRQHASAANCNAGISLTGASDDITIVDPDIVCLGTDAVAPIKGITTLSTNVRVLGGILVSDNEPGIELLTGTTGVFNNTRIFSDLATIAAATVADGCAHFQVKYVEVGNESDAVVKTASVDD